MEIKRFRKVGELPLHRLVVDLYRDCDGCSVLAFRSSGCNSGYICQGLSEMMDWSWRDQWNKKCQRSRPGKWYDFSFAPVCHDGNMATDLYHVLLQTWCPAWVWGAQQSWAERSEIMTESNLSFLSRSCHIIVTECGRNYHSRLLRKRLRDARPLMKRTKAQVTGIVLRPGQ